MKRNTSKILAMAAMAMAMLDRGMYVSVASSRDNDSSPVYIPKRQKRKGYQKGKRRK